MLRFAEFYGLLERVAEFGRFLRASARLLIRDYSTKHLSVRKPVITAQKKLLRESWPWATESRGLRQEFLTPTSCNSQDSVLLAVF